MFDVSVKSLDIIQQKIQQFIKQREYSPWDIGKFWIKLLVRAHQLHNIQLKLWKNYACVSKIYFLLKIFSARFHSFRKLYSHSLYKSTAQAFSVCFIWLNVLNIDENSLQIQTAINTLYHFYFSFCRKKLFCNQEKFRKIKFVED